MKKIYLALGIAASVMLSSCSDFLDREPSTELPSETAITTVDDLENAVNGIGYLLSGDPIGFERMTYPAEFGLFADFRSQDFKVADENGQTSEIRKYNYNPNGVFPTYGYKIFYAALANVNNALASIPNIEGDEATINDFKGQLLAWRGLLHFDLARMFCYIPTTVDNPEQSLGLVISNDIYPTNYKGTRANLKTTYDFIIEQFTEAIPLLNEKSDNGYLNKYAALALRARANLYAGKYQEALADAKDVIANGKYKMLNRDNYVDAWGKEGADETIFELLITDKYNPQRYGMGYYCDADGYPECSFDKEGYLYQYLKANEDKDIRAGLIKEQTIEKKSYAFPNKYPGRDGNSYVNDPKIIRLSEVYLIAAEAQWHIDNPGSYEVTASSADAAQYINKIQENRIEGYEGVSSVTLEDILHQYEIEMFCENQITFAYWRNHQNIKASDLGREIEYNDYRTIMPIPQSERDQNANLEQNPGY